MPERSGSSTLRLICSRALWLVRQAAAERGRREEREDDERRGADVGEQNCADQTKDPA
ncbi:hypothetical protein D3C73_1474750 [compost metagenome]